ncbi:MAG: hypothetical protein D8M58_02765 [Calditrichaeota bacterium]|nr:MAG: hypothetical protein DWQ03_04315 [Calditrichota bacterium]MBL1204286.1 hypothetical protein [Calditrichota bacterium]NOG44116.1 hypothetical protein [Calditrichota bacterium]
MKHHAILITFTLILLIITSCSENSVKPAPEEKLCEITDTTSHDFTWRVDTLGLFPSALYDVAAIDENNVWAVGEIELSTGRYNAVKWNGSEYQYFQVFDNTGLPRIDVVLAFDTQNIWMFAGDRYHYLVGDSFITGNIKPGEAKGSTKAAWGLSSSDYYLVGDHGSISHYDGTSFELMESGTDKNLHDVTGYVDPETGITHVWAAGELILLHYDGSQWETVWDENNPVLPDNYNHPGAIFAPNHKQLLVAAWYPQIIRGYCINSRDVTEFKEIFKVDLFAYAMDGPAINDFFIVGSWNKVAHFNGNSLREYPEITGGSNRSVSYVNDKVFIVGPLAEQLGLFIHGTRN